MRLTRTSDCSMYTLRCSFAGLFSARFLLAVWCRVVLSAGGCCYQLLSASQLITTLITPARPWCAHQCKAHGPARTCNESKEEK